MFYYGISLGGIMGTWFAALSPDLERLNVDGPVDSALVVYDTGSYDIFRPAHYQTKGSGPLIPPLRNLIPSGTCDPHAARVVIPASLDQRQRSFGPAAR
jgi:hypothetical protein